MKIKQTLIAALLVLSAFQARCDDYSPPMAYVILDIVMFKPLGLAVTIAGAGAYAGLSPLIAFANISPPHQAFQSAADILVAAPADFTFVRPLGMFYPYQYPPQ